MYIKIYYAGGLENALQTKKAAKKQGLCRKGYQQSGMKTKDGKKVLNPVKG